MRKLLVIFILLFLSSIDAFNQEQKFVFKKDLIWKDGPPSLPKGCKIAILEGDMKEGPFTVRLMFPPNFKVPPHFHPAMEHVTVLEGTLYLGVGEVFDKKKTTAMNPGDFEVMPVQHPHFAYTKGRVIIQAHAVAPWAVTYVNEKDDPRK